MEHFFKLFLLYFLHEGPICFVIQKERKKEGKSDYVYYISPIINLEEVLEMKLSHMVQEIKRGDIYS
jgi:hypothetical protein